MPPEFSAGEVLTEEELRFLKGCGRNTKIFRGCRLLPPQVISIGNHTQIDEGVKVFGGQGVELGHFVHLAFDSSISGGGFCSIGNFVSVGAGVRIITGTDLPEGLANPTIPPAIRSVRRSEVKIGDFALIYTNSVVLPGVQIGEGAVASAGTIIHYSLKPWTIYAGFPLVPVGTRDEIKIKLLAAELPAFAK